MTPAIELRGLSKRFGDCVANADISLTVRAGAIHAVIGENGAGKSTAMKLLYGQYTPDTGEIVVKGVARRWRSPADAIAAGIGMVHQHFMLAGPHTALENVVLGAEPAKFRGLWPRAFRPVDWSAARARLREISRQYGLEVNWDAPVESLPVGIQQRIEIVKLLYRNADILILDEPTAVLTPQETTELFANFRTLAAQGRTIIIITHKLREVRALASAVTVFRAGRVVAEVQAAEVSETELAQLMVGRAVTLEVAAPPESARGPVVLEVRELRLAGAAGSARPRLEAIDLEIREGEIVGVAGVEGNGQQELLDLLVRPQDFRGEWTGKLRLFHADVTTLGTRALRERGLGVIPADRIREGLLLERPLTENFLLGFQRDSRFASRFGVLAPARARAAAAAGMEEFDVRPRDPDAIAGRLSGGNQQKLIIARELSRRIRLLIAAQPTRGVDVGAIEFIHQKIFEARNSGVGVLLVSSELSEVMTLSDRIVVMYGGRIVASFARGEADEKTLGLWMAGGPRGEAAP